MKVTSLTNGAMRPMSKASPNATGTAPFSQLLAFDKTDFLPVEDMQTWWDSSPYYAVGIYLPGSPNRSSNHTYATQDWIDAVMAQGWGLWPIWFGLQAPCVNYPGKITQFISTDPSAAAAQGAQQADAAYNAATNLGLDGSIMYFDIEPYSTQSGSCSAAVQAYIGGFVAEMHDDAPGSSVGVYGDVYVAPGLSITME